MNNYAYSLANGSLGGRTGGGGGSNLGIDRFSGDFSIIEKELNINKTKIQTKLKPGSGVDVDIDGNISAKLPIESVGAELFLTDKQLNVDMTKIQGYLTAGGGVSIKDGIITVDIGLKTILVESLPVIGVVNTIYLVKTSPTANIYSQSIWMDDSKSYVNIGSTEIDLSSYVKKETGKSLSTNDFDNLSKKKVDDIKTDGLGNKFLSDKGSYEMPSSLVVNINDSHIGEVYTFMSQIDNAEENFGLMEPKGQILQKADYPEYYDFALMSTSSFIRGLVVGDTVRLPNWKARYLRNQGDANGVNNAGRLGETKGDCIRNITGIIETKLSSGDTSTVLNGAGVFDVATSGQCGNGGTKTAGMKPYSLNFNAANVVPTGTENNVFSVAIIYYIKVKNIVKDRQMIVAEPSIDYAYLVNAVIKFNGELYSCIKNTVWKGAVNTDWKLITGFVPNVIKTDGTGSKFLSDKGTYAIPPTILKSDGKGDKFLADDGTYKYVDNTFNCYELLNVPKGAFDIALLVPFREAALVGKTMIRRVANASTNATYFVTGYLADADFVQISVLINQKMQIHTFMYGNKTIKEYEIPAVTV